MDELPMAMLLAHEVDEDCIGTQRRHKLPEWVTVIDCV